MIEASEALHWGILRGQPIHWACANEDAVMMCWGRFAARSQAEGEICVCCGGSVAADPIPGFDPICPL